MVATVIGVATTLGFGAAQINGGLNYLFGIPNNALVQVIIIIITTILFTISALSGLGKGVKNLIKHQSYFSGWTTRHHHNHRSHSPDF